MLWNCARLLRRKVVITRNFNPDLVQHRDLCPISFQPIDPLHFTYRHFEMDSFPQELIDRITSFLAYNDLKNTLLVSRKFQYAAERASGEFAFFAFRKHTPDEQQDFLSKFGGGGRRFRYLRDVHVRTSVPPLIDSSAPLEEAGPCRESIEELFQRDVMFSEQIKGVWNTLHEAEQTQTDGAGRIQIRMFTPTQFISDDDEDSGKTRKLDLRVIIDLASKLPNLEYLGCKIGTYEWADSRDAIREHFMLDYLGCRRDTRIDFATAVRSTSLPATLKYVQLDFINKIDESLQEQSKRLPNLVGSMAFDPFSSSLRLLSYSLRRMNLHVVADKSLFLPSGDDLPPSWPNLEFLTILFHICSPSGEWYFEGPLGEDDDDDDNDANHQIAEDHVYPPFEDDIDEKEEWCYREGVDTPEPECTFRVVPREEQLVPFLEAFAQAAANMPRLLEAWLWAPMRFSPEGLEEEDDEDIMEQYSENVCGWGLKYDAPGGCSTDGVTLTTTRRIKWRVGSWRPNANLHQYFRSIGEQYYGPLLEETWHEVGQVETLLRRDWFNEGEEFGTLMLTITGSSGATHPTQDDCSANFNTIVSTCIDHSYLRGGDLVASEIAYSIAIISNDLSHQDKRVRARARGGRASNKRPAAKRPKAKRPTSKQKITKHPASKQPTSKKRPGKRPTKSRSRAGPTKTSTNKYTPTPSKPVKLKPLKTCKQLHVELAQEEQRLARAGGLEKRFDSAHFPLPELVTRAKKGKGRAEAKGKKTSGVKTSEPCSAAGFKSNRYQPFSLEIDENKLLPVFGYKKEVDCANYEWFKGVPGLKQGTKDEKGQYKYDTEHVLEWNTIAQFFDIFLDKKFAKDKISNADPKNDIESAHGVKGRRKEDFCAAWRTTWGSWPKDQGFKLDKNDPSRSPFEHIADVYPSAKPPYKREEFTGLQKSLNQLKLRFFKWNDKPEEFDDGWVPVPSQLYNEKMSAAGTPQKGSLGDQVLNDPGAALLRLRNVVGVRMYLNDKKVRKAMRDVKIRLQDRFDELERALADPKNARSIVSSGSERLGTQETTRTLHPWKILNLGALWDEYMNEKWEMAGRHEQFVSKWEGKLRKRYCLAKHRNDAKIGPKDSKEEQHRKQVTADLCPKLQKFTVARKNAMSTKFSAPWKASTRTQRPKNDAIFQPDRPNEEQGQSSG
ncbi:hypothetical protein SLS60_010743 [Paraconiothyrium brasiliense]|uniref:F-box domain-containing protein n=1 Tax=Paraconiothyrium brasiliense TaxID=300254 RepID=A0ABR3QLV7_9PLEO